MNMSEDYRVVDILLHLDDHDFTPVPGLMMHVCLNDADGEENSMAVSLAASLSERTCLHVQPSLGLMCLRPFRIQCVLLIFDVVGWMRFHLKICVEK
jgi:hypothetical protein